MTDVASAFVGALIGAAGSLPGVLLAKSARRGGHPTVAVGIGVTVSSFCLLSFAVGMGYLVLSDGFMAYSVGMAVAFLGTWIVESIVAWRWINGRRGRL